MILDKPNNLFIFDKKIYIYIFAFISIIIFLYQLFYIIYKHHVPDFRIIYLSCHAWLNGINPYDHILLRDLWLKLGCPPNFIPNTNTTPSIYPLTTFVILSPFGLLSWQNASLFWKIINLASIISIYIGSLSLSRITLKDHRSLLFFGLLLLLQPLYLSLSLGQPTLLSASFLFTSLCLSTFNSRYQLLSGIFMALSLGLKPLIGILFFVYYVLRKRWRIITSCIIFICFLLLIGVTRLGVNESSWIVLWLKNLQMSFSSGGVNDPSIYNYYAIFLTNLQHPLFFLTDNRIIVNLTIILLIFPLLIILFKFNLDQAMHDDLLLIFTIITLISLMGFYHRSQDAILLVFPIILSITLIYSSNKLYAYFILIALSPFFNPLMRVFARNFWRYYFVEGKSLSLFNKIFCLSVISYQSISLLILSFIIVHYAWYRKIKR